MILQTRLSELAVRIALECKALRKMINGSATDLSPMAQFPCGRFLGRGRIYAGW
jgi:hypothetical protein